MQFTPAPAHAVADGLLGWTRMDVKGIRIDGVGVRRTRSGRLTLSFPVRIDRYGIEHTIVLPVSVDDQRRLQTFVLDELRRQGSVLP